MTTYWIPSLADRWFTLEDYRDRMTWVAPDPLHLHNWIPYVWFVPAGHLGPLSAKDLQIWVEATP